MATQLDTHEVFNQPPPLEGYDVFTADSALVEAVEREGAGWARPELEVLGAEAGSASAPGARAPGQREPAGAAHLRPLREPDRRRRVPPCLPRADDDGGGARTALGTLGRPPRRCPRGPGGQGDHLVPGGRRAHLPGLDDLRGGARAPPSTRGGRGVGADDPLHHLRPVQPARRGQGRGHLRHGPHREAGRVRRAGQHHPGRADRRPGPHLPAHRPQVVLLGAHVGRLPHAGPGSGRPQLLPRPTLAARRHPQPHPHPAPEGQAG